MVPFWERLCAVAAMQPQRPALESGGEVVSYAALQRRAAGLGAALRGAGVRPGDRVGLYLDKSIDYVVALLGCWAAGAAFVPLEAALPAARLRWMAADAGLRWAVAPRPRWGELPGLHWLDPQEQATPEPALPADTAAPQPAYVIYTSGSSGVPKGVLVGHGGVLNLLDAQIAAFGMSASSRSLLYLSISFDASLSDIGAALLSGACLCIEPGLAALSPAGLARRLGELGITHLDLPPALLGVLDPESLPAALTTLIIGGEVCPAETVRRHAARRRVINVYGPTEATVCVSLCVCDTNWERPLLGRPLPGVRLRVVAGELWIGGPALALGYLGQPALSAARFIEQDGVRWYRSGDRVREHGDGELEFLGRSDRQLKLRGRLVAPEEVEAALLRQPGITRAAVVLHQEGPEGKTWPALWAYLEGAAPSGWEEALRAQLGRELPAWLIPQRLVMQPRLPETPAGKIDLPALAALAALAASPDFAALGGDSLAALEVAACLPGASARRPLAELRADALGLLEGEVLLTGATGHLGTRLLGELLRGGARRVHCLIRARDATEALARLQSALARRGCRLEPDQWARVAPLCGDITRPRLGLTAEAWEALAAALGEVHHLAALVNAALPYEDLRSANLVGTHRVLTLCQQGRPKRLHHASTLSVVLQAVGDDVCGGYAQSKAAAEALLEASGPHWCHRLGLLTGPALTTAPEGAADDPLSGLLRGLALVGAVPAELQEDLRLDITPVDWAAAVLARLRQAPPGRHVVSAPYGGVALGELLAALRQHGVALPRVSSADFRACGAGLRHPEALTAHLALAAALPAAVPPAQRPFALFFPALPAPRIVVPGPALPPLAELLRRYIAAALHSR